MAMEVVSDKIEVKVSGECLWKALCEKAPLVIPKAMPEAIEKVVDDGDCFQPGTIRTFYYQKSFLEKKAKEKNVETVIPYTKKKFVQVDPQTHTLKFEVIEGGFLGVLVKKYYVSTRVESVGTDASILHWAYKYEPLSDEHKDRIPQAFTQKMAKSIGALEAFLTTHKDC